MNTLTSTTIRSMQECSWQLGACRTEEQLERVALDFLYSKIPCAYAALTDFATLPAKLRMVITPVDGDLPELERRIDDHVHGAPTSDHPLVAHYFINWQSLTPLRLSDISSDRDLRSTRAYSDVFGPFGINRQIALISRRNSPIDNAGYAISRDGSDFTDDELALATGLQPILMAVSSVLRTPAASATEASARHGLTAAEVAVLNLVATGMTAVAIARARGVSPRTIRKQLESVYNKLGRHDRLQAVTYAHTVGILPPTTDTQR